MSAADTIRETLIALANTPSEYGKREVALAALDELEAELARAWAAVKDEAEQTCIEIDLRRATEVELERLTVGRATLEDQTNRAELAEARADVFEAALRQIAAAGYVRTGAGGFDDPASTTSDPRLEGLADIAHAALVLSGGSE